MKRHVQEFGIREYFGADLMELQREPLSALDAIFAEYDPCVIQGCEISVTIGSKYNIAAGMVALMAIDTDGGKRVMVMPFEGVSDITLPIYLMAQSTPVMRAYGNGKMKPIAHNYVALATSVAPNIPSLELTAAGGNRFVDILLKDHATTEEMNTAIDAIQVGSLKGFNYVGFSQETIFPAGTSLFTSEALPLLTKLATGETYTLSADVEVLQGVCTSMLVMLFNKPGDSIVVSASVPIVDGRIKWTFTLASDLATQVLIYNGIQSDISFRQIAVRNLMLEKGNTATEWSPDLSQQVVLPPSLVEQIVPGEFWLGVDGVSRQVYQRSFRGNIPLEPQTLSDARILSWYFRMTINPTNFNAMKIISGGLSTGGGPSSGASLLIHQWDISIFEKHVLGFISPNSALLGSPYSVTLQYTKS